MRTSILFFVLIYGLRTSGQDVIPITNASLPYGFVESVTQSSNEVYALFQTSSRNDTFWHAIYKFDGVVWNPVEQELMTTRNTHINCILYWNGVLYIGGSFMNFRGIYGANLVMSYSNGVFSPLGNGIADNYLTPSVECMTVFQNKLVVGGKFRLPGGTFNQPLAQWDGTSWTSLGALVYWSINCPVPAMIENLLADGDKLFLQGNFTIAGTLPAYNIVYYQNGSYHSMGGGFDNNNWYNSTPSIVKVENDIYTMEMLQNSSQQWVKSIVKWDGTH